MKILFILTRFPYPIEKGDKLRAYHQIEILSEKHEIFLFALSDTKVHNLYTEHLGKLVKKMDVFYLSPFRIGINLLRSLYKKLPFQVAYFYSSAAKKRLEEFISITNPDQKVFQLVRTAGYANNSSAGSNTLDYMDALSKGIERRMPSIPFYLRPLYRIEYKKLLFYENLVFEKFKNKLIISEKEREWIPHKDKNTIAIISNGVDTEYFVPAITDKKYDILFSGNMSYPPNEEGVIYLVTEIFPLVLKSHPGAVIMISGANPSRKVLELRASNVHVSGWVDDIRDNFYKSKMLVAPMISGTGLQNKLLEAMAMKIPCITSRMANDSLGGTHEVNILEAGKPEEFAKCINRLLEDEPFARQIARNGYDFVTRNYNWNVETAKLEKILSDTL